MSKKKDLTHTITYSLLGILIIAGGIFGYIKISSQNESIAGLSKDLENQKIKYIELEGALANKEKDLADLLALNDNLNQSLASEQQVVAQQINKLDDLEDEIDDFEKLQELDPELLKKYSKVYFLNEHYEPPKLREIDEEYWINEDKPQQIHKDVWPFLKRLLRDAKKDNIELRVLSAFRSFEYQGDLKHNYTVTYGADSANRFSADQGYSEHQLGTTVDFTTTFLGNDLDNFDKSDAYPWLLENAHKFGFVLSYPPNNAYYIFEPWHWRFVGRDLADDLHDDEKYFYDLDQREIDEYLIKLFD